MSSKKELVVVGDSYCVDYIVMRNKLHITSKRPYFLIVNYKTKEFKWEYIKPYGFWGDIIAKELNLKLVNLSTSGSGNSQIFAKSLDYITKNKNKIGKIIISWSGWYRMDFEPENKNDLWKNINTVVPVGLVDGNVGRDNHDTLVDIMRKTKIINYNSILNKFIRYVYLMQIMCESLNIDYYMISSIFEKDPDNQKIYEYIISKMLLKNSYFELINEDKFIGWPICENLGGYCMQNIIHSTNKKYLISAYDNHPNELGHKLIGQHILNEIL